MLTGVLRQQQFRGQPQRLQITPASLPTLRVQERNLGRDSLPGNISSVTEPLTERAILANALLKSSFQVDVLIWQL